MKSIATSLIAAAFAVNFADAASAQTFIGNFGDWSAFHDGTGRDKTCYIASLPKTTAPQGVSRGKTYVLVTHRPAEKTRNVIELRAGYAYREGSEVELSVDGNKPFELFTNDGSAWAHDSPTDQAIAEAMKKGIKMTVVGTSSRGTKTTDTYSLSGISAALAAIDKECK